jgi:hypothetical protein
MRSLGENATRCVCRIRWEENVERLATATSPKVIFNYKSKTEKKQLTNEILKRNIVSQYANYPNRTDKRRKKFLQQIINKDSVPIRAASVV